MYIAYIIMFSITPNNPIAAKLIIPISNVIFILGHLFIIFSNNYELIKWSLVIIAFLRTGLFAFILNMFANYFNSEVFKISAVLANMSFAIYGLLYPMTSVLFNGNYILLNTMDTVILTMIFLIFMFNIF